MYSNSKIAKAVRLAMVFGASAATAVSMPAFSEEAADEQVERIQVTGSAIKRTDMEGSLPITTITTEDIARSGVTNVPDLVQQIPSMQGFIAAGESVGGGGGGMQTASLRDLGSQYTLVLLNGRRMASADSGATIDLNSIPLAAIKRVEILTDGASAIYGSDAIAGVLNFILKDDFQDFNVTARIDRPLNAGGDQNQLSISGGYGDLSSDGFNVMFSYSHHEQDQLRSVDRDFAKSGFLPFTWNEEEYISIQGSSNAIPGNAYLTFTDESGLDNRSFNPYRLNNGDCHGQSAPSTSSDTCVFDYTSTLEIYPETERDNLLVQGVLAVGDDHEVYGTASFSETSLISRIAPYPTGLFTLPIDSGVVQSNVIPNLSAEEVAGLERVSARWRILPGGNRTTDWNTEVTNFTVGMRGELGDWSYDVALTSADSERQEYRVTGFPIQEDFLNLVQSGAVDVFADPASLSDEQNQMVRDTMFNGLWEKTDTSMEAIEGQASAPIFELPAGEAYMAVGFDYREVEYKRTNGQGNTDEIILFESASAEYDLSRETYGAFVEFAFPVVENLEVTAAVRYDNIGKITDSELVGNQIIGKDQNDVTYKIAASLRPNDDWLLRASFGTGFKAPSMRQIAEPIVEFGVTSVAYDCPFAAGDALAAACYDDKLQYDVFREGNGDLQPETSEQTSMGFVYAPDNSFSFGMDLWKVDLADQVDRLTQNQIFFNPELYREYFTTKVDPGTGDTVLAIIQPAVNIGKSKNSGIDWDLNLLNEFGFGTLKTSFKGTYMIQSERLRAGTTDVWDTSLGKVGTNDAVTFRTVYNLTNTLELGDLALTATIKYKSGYDDIPQDECAALTIDRTECAPSLQLAVPSYTLVDLVGRYNVMDGMVVAVGVNNVFDKAPPLTLNGDAGHQVGYDPRYTDVFGRTVYASIDYTF